MIPEVVLEEIQEVLEEIQEVPVDRSPEALLQEEPEARIQALRQRMISSRNKSLNEMPAFLGRHFSKKVTFPEKEEVNYG